MTITFAVDDVKPAVTSSYPYTGAPTTDIPKAKSLVDNLVKNVESYKIDPIPTDSKILMPQGINPGLAHIVGEAYQVHYDLVLSPDLIWQTIESGIAIHVKENAETLRDRFVNFQGKKEIIISANDFVKGDSNDWQRLFPKFEEKIREDVGDKVDLLVANFSTTTPLLKAVSQIMLMDAMSKYFDYTVRTMCGIPHITLTGEVSDWQNIYDRVQKIRDLDIGLESWTRALLPVLQEFISAASGTIDLRFWSELYKINGGSGSPSITGYILRFYPYTEHHGRYRIVNHQSQYQLSMTSDNIPGTLSKVAFKWEYYTETFPMQFTGGVIGGAVKGNEIQPVFGWIVSYDNAKDK